MSRVEMTSMTHPGIVRDENEDNLSTFPEAGLAVLADGMGGHLAGEVASGMAVNFISRQLLEALAASVKKPKSGRGAAPRDEPTLSAELVGRIVKEANQAIFQVAQARPECTGMGSTIVVVLFHGHKVYFAHVGDSRLYRYRKKKLEQLTQDHSVVQELVNRGLFTIEEARASIGKNLVTRALGVDPGVAPDVGEQSVDNDDIFLLCSDGLNDVVSDEDIAAILAAEAKQLDSAVRRLVQLANQRGGPDNISVILARSGGRFQPDPDELRKIHDAMQDQPPIEACDKD